MSTFGPDKNVLVIGWREAGLLPQPFEHEHKHNVVVFYDYVEYRILEQLQPGMKKYVIHTETFPASGQIDRFLFEEVFEKVHKHNDPLDVRKAIRWAIKGSIMSPIVVR